MKRAEKQYNKEVDAYRWFVVNMETKYVHSGFEYKQDAIDLMSDFDPGTVKIVAKNRLAINGIVDPCESWKYKN